MSIISRTGKIILFSAAENTQYNEYVGDILNRLDKDLEFTDQYKLIQSVS